MKLFTRVMALVALFFIAGQVSFAQKGSKTAIAEQYIQANLEKSGLSQEDVQDLHLQDEYVSKSSGVTHLIYIQRYKGVEVYNAIWNIAITKEGKAFSTGNRLKANLATSINTMEPAINALGAVEKAARQLGVTMLGTASPVLKRKVNDREYIFEGTGFSNSEIPVKLCLQKQGDQLRLAWNLSIDMLDNADYWSVRIDATSGQIIDKNNYTAYCKFDKGHAQSMEAVCSEEHSHEVSTNAAFMAPSASYRVFAMPAESPIHGPQIMVTDPHDTLASPLGWHDVDGVDGAEYTITRGNNVHAYLDLNDNNVSAGDEPDGGPDLIFDYPYDAAEEPSEMTDAAVTNLFYMNNYIHDFSYRYGFDEAAGNFQQTNYTGEGTGGDYVHAQAQDGGGTNNANFSTPPDGGNGRMQMYLWGRSTGALRVDSPAEIEGWYDTGTAAFGPDIDDNTNITGNIVEVDDAEYDPYNTDGCEAIVNSNELAGNIALIDRGGCFFELKTVNAEEAGAIAVIICNFDEDAMGMAGVPEIDNPTIPTISLGKSDCDAIRLYLDQGVEVFIGRESSGGPQNVDGDFDNGIIAHEFAHGISNRLTGGPNTGGCLGNEEQMGEGWSDFFSLVTTVQPGDDGAKVRGIGTFAQFQTPTGRGIRPYPYSTDMNTNPLTYNDISQLSIPHGLGSVWCTMLWDMYWAFVDVYGFDQDLMNGSGGNNMAVQLVMDGMKYQVCNPGFVDGRDAILLADEVLYNGANQCLIWEVFARRGLGYYADQGSSNNAADGTESYEALPTCIKELKITKEVTPLIKAGDDVTVTLNIINHKEDSVSDLVIADELPTGMSFIEIESTTGIDKANITADTDVPGMVSFTWNENGSTGLGTLEEATITYRVATSPDKYSTRMYFDDIPDNSLNTEDRWLIGIESDQNTSSNIWLLSDTEAYSGDWAWNVDDHWLDTRQVLELFDDLPLTGTTPVIRFYHKYDAFPGRHGGVFEISTNGGISYENSKDRFIRNGYSGQIIYQAFTIPDFYAFFGQSGEFVDSYVDVSDLAGSDIRIRYRFGTQDTTEFSSAGNPAYRNYFGTNQGGTGWTIDDFELMDLFSYNGEVCITSAEGDNVCANAPNRGTIVDSQEPSDVKDLGAETSVAVYPNPASDILTFSFEAKENQDIDIQIVSLDGKLVQQIQRKIYQGSQAFSINVSMLPEGFYFVKMRSGDDFVTEKVMIQR